MLILTVATFGKYFTEDAYVQISISVYFTHLILMWNLCDFHLWLRPALKCCLTNHSAAKGRGRSEELGQFDSAPWTRSGYLMFQMQDITVILLLKTDWKLCLGCLWQRCKFPREVTGGNRFPLSLKPGYIMLTGSWIVWLEGSRHPHTRLESTRTNKLRCVLNHATTSLV